MTKIFLPRPSEDPGPQKNRRPPAARPDDEPGPAGEAPFRSKEISDRRIVPGSLGPAGASLRGSLSPIRKELYQNRATSQTKSGNRAVGGAKGRKTVLGPERCFFPGDVFLVQFPSRFCYTYYVFSKFYAMITHKDGELDSIEN